MHYQRYTHRLETAPGKFRAMSSGRSGHRVAVDVRKVDARLFENTTITQHPATPAATSFALPAIFGKLCAIYGAQLLANCILKVEQELFNLVCVGLHNLPFFRVCFLVVKPMEITDHAFGNGRGDFLTKRRRA